MNRFSKQQLFSLRNQIPINFLIEKILKIPSRYSEGHFRFLCPLCFEFNTATNPKTNLARCFSCNKNFNTIDFIMISKNKNFTQTVSFLLSLLKGLQKLS